MKGWIPLGVVVLVVVFVLPLRQLLRFEKETRMPLRYSVVPSLGAKAISISVHSQEPEHGLEVRFIEIPVKFQQASGIRFPAGFEEMKLRENPGQTNKELNKAYGFKLDETPVIRLQGRLKIPPGGIQKIVFPADEMRLNTDSAWVQIEIVRVLEEFRYFRSEPVKVDFFGDQEHSK